LLSATVLISVLVPHPLAHIVSPGSDVPPIVVVEARP